MDGSVLTNEYEKMTHTPDIDAHRVTSEWAELQLSKIDK
jgi:hypothetical protein